MEKLEKMYTIEEIAEMTSVTSRTIRNYLKKGLFKGRKVGGVWRFTKNDIEDLFNNSTFINKASDIHKQYVYDFLDTRKKDTDFNTSVCTVLDFYCDSKQISLTLFNETIECLGESFMNAKIYYEYLESRSTARFTIFCDIMLMTKIINIINLQIDHL
ncbi:MAG TPA: helix-turn-helix domain-containing protein [Lachnospiraceae bacterium]|nr:helix-turn-helix domain-containing protein [Lachnospiraceae bacterium]